MGRVVAASGAGAVGQGINIAIQVISLPAFLAVWSPAEYGVWLMLSALTAYLSMADVGLVTAVGNEMTMANGRGDRVGANRLFQSALAFMLIVCGSLAAVSLLLIGFLPLDSLNSTDRQLALSALALTTVLALFSGLTDAVFRSTGRYAQGLMVANFARLAEWLGWMAGLALTGSYAAVAVGGLIARLLGLLVAVWLSARGSHRIYWQLEHARLAEVRRLARPAVSFMAFPLSNALNFQGMTLLVGHVFGPALLALFNTYRTLTRVATQLTGMLSHAVWPEFSRMYGKGDRAGVRRLYRRWSLLCGVLAIALSLLLFAGAPLLLQRWTHGAIAFEPVFMGVMLLYAALAGLWHVSRVFLLSTNQHVGLAGWVVATAALSLALGAALGDTWGLSGFGGVLVLTEIAIAGICFALAARVLRRASPGAAA